MRARPAGTTAIADGPGVMAGATAAIGDPRRVWCLTVTTGLGSDPGVVVVAADEDSFQCGWLCDMAAVDDGWNSAASALTAKN